MPCSTILNTFNSPLEKNLKFNNQIRAFRETVDELHSDPIITPKKIPRVAWVPRPAIENDDVFFAIIRALKETLNVNDFKSTVISKIPKGDPRLKSADRIVKRAKRDPNHESISGLTIFTYGTARSSGWYGSLNEVGLHIGKVYRAQNKIKNVPTFNKIVRALAPTVDLTSESIRLIPSGDPRLKSAEEIVGGPISGYTIYMFGLEQKDGWYPALRRAGIVIEQPRAKWSPEIVLAILRDAAAKSYAMNPGALRQELVPELKPIIKKYAGKETNTDTFYMAIIRYFGSPREAFAKAGLDPDAYYLKAPRVFGFLDSQVERVENPDGTIKYVRYLGTPAKTPEELVEDNESITSLYKAMNLLGARDRRIAQMMLKYLEVKNDLSDTKALMNFINQEIHDAAKKDVDRLLQTLLEELS